MHPKDRRFSATRRDFLRRTGGAAFALSAAGLLEACSNSTTAGQQNTGSSGQLVGPVALEETPAVVGVNLGQKQQDARQLRLPDLHGLFLLDDCGYLPRWGWEASGPLALHLSWKPGRSVCGRRWRA